MFRFLVFSTLIALALSATIQDATQTEEFKQWSGRIVGGQTAAPGQFPYQTSMRNAANAHFCGGFIINHRTIGCAAHCTINRTPATTVTVVGTNHRITGGTQIPTQSIVNHPNYNSATLAFDISVVITQVPVVFSDLVQPIALGSAHVEAGLATASGWGQTSHPGAAATELQFVPKNLITNEDCRSRLSALQAARIGDSTICAASPGGQGLCMGDSGGPLTFANTVVGAVSWGIPCGTTAPDMFARISAVHDWLVAETVV